MSDDSLRARIHDAISTAMRDTEASMLGPWVLTAATIDADGIRSVWVITAPDTASYEAKGLLAEATDRVREDGLEYAWYPDDEDEDEQ